MKAMFAYCNNLINLNLSSFNTKNVTDMSAMFQGCNKLNNLDLYSFNTNIVTKITGIFFDCPKKIFDDNKSKFEKFNYNDMVKECTE